MISSMNQLQRQSRPVLFGLSSLILGIVGWIASFELLTEYVKTLANPDHVPNCNISILVTCGPNMAAAQGSIFGFPNPILGVSMFMAPIIVGVALLAGARFPRWFWSLYQLGLAFGFGFIAWLSFQSIFVLGTLCPWCMVVWLVMIPLFWTTLFHPYAREEFPVSAGTRDRFQSLSSWTWVFIAVSYIIIAMAAQLRLDWWSELMRAFS